MQMMLGGTPLFYQRYGRGTPVLIMHGGPGLDHSYFRPYLDALGDCAELIYYDHRGSGRSGGRADLGQATLESWAEDAEVLRETLRLPRVVVLGHGFGGFIAQTYARMYPDQLRGLVLCNTSATLDDPARMLAQAHELGGPEAIGALIACMSQPAGSDEALRQRWRQALPAYFYRYQPVFGTAMDEGMIYSADAYNRGMFQLAPHFSSHSWLGQVRTPALIMAGAHDLFASRAQGLPGLQALLPRAQVQVFDSSGHYPFIEEPTGFCHTLRHFIRQLPP